MSHVVRKTQLAIAIAAALYPGVAALAAASGGQKLEEVIVTATRREVNLQDVAQSVSALSTADITRLKLQDLKDVVGTVPSIAIVNDQPGRNSLIMRGVATGSAEYRTDSQVSVYLDDQPLTSISQQVDIRPTDIARIEVLPGPQGTLFGSSSQTGTLRYITNKPDSAAFAAETAFEIGTTKGGEASYDVDTWVNFPITDSIAVRAVGFYSQEGGYVDNVFGTTLRGDADNAALVEDDFNDYAVYGGRVAARWQINPEWETTATYIDQRGRADGAWESDPFLGDYKIARFFNEFRKDNWNQSSLNVKGDLGFAELSVSGSYFDRKVTYAWDDMAYDQWRSTTIPIACDDLTAPGCHFGVYYALYDTGDLIGVSRQQQKQNRWTYEARLTSLGTSRFQWMAGAFYEDVYDWWDYGNRTPGLMTSIAWQEAQRQACEANAAGYDVACPLAPTEDYYVDIYDKTIIQKAIFGELTFALTDKWSITGGARWFEYNRREYDIYNGPRGLPSYQGLPDLGRVDRKGTDSDTVFKFGTEYHIDDKRMVYALYSEGFRLGGQNSQRAASTGVLPLVYEPDTLKNYEAGLKSTWLDNRVLLNISLFLMEWDHIQLNESSGDPWWVRGTFNGGTAEQKGVEISGSAKVTESLSFEFSAFLADPEFTEETIYPNGDVLPKGAIMPDSARRKYSASVDYQFPRFGAIDGNFWTRAQWSYTGEIWNSTDAIIDNDRELVLPAWKTTTFQAGFTHSSAGWEAALIVRNLFDQKGINWMSENDYGADFGDPRFRYIRTLTRPRSISLSFTKSW